MEGHGEAPSWFKIDLRRCGFGYFKTAAESLINLPLRVLTLLRGRIPHGHLKALVAEPVLYGPGINAAP